MADGLPEPVEVNRSTLLGNIPHGFLGRIGGVSAGDVAGLQVGLNAGDDDVAVQENRRRAVAATCPGTQLVTVKQVHSPIATYADAPWAEDARPEADAMVTDRPGLALAIVTADCAPVLLADENAGVIGAAHAGWRGAHGGVIERTVGAMEKIGARRSSIKAAIGPCIAQSSYEVGEDFHAHFDGRDALFFEATKPGKWQFDLEDYVAAQLQRAGVESVERLGLDTYALESRFFSHRRSVHRCETTYGRQFSMISMSD